MSREIKVMARVEIEGAGVVRFVALLSQPLRQCDREVLIDEESHSAARTG